MRTQEEPAFRVKRKKRKKKLPGLSKPIYQLQGGGQRREGNALQKCRPTMGVCNCVASVRGGVSMVDHEKSIGLDLRRAEKKGEEQRLFKIKMRKTQLGTVDDKNARILRGKRLIWRVGRKCNRASVGGPGLQGK